MALNLPEFASEKEEADWWYDHRDEVSDDFAASAAEGKVRSVRDMLLEDHNLILPDAFVSLPMSNADLAKVKEIAAKHGLGAEEYLSKAVHAMLEVERAA
jgi:predicted DNA binding CopG/RHH family protein